MGLQVAKGLNFISLFNSAILLQAARFPGVHKARHSIHYFKSQKDNYSLTWL